MTDEISAGARAPQKTNLRQAALLLLAVGFLAGALETLFGRLLSSGLSAAYLTHGEETYYPAHAVLLLVFFLAGCACYAMLWRYAAKGRMLPGAVAAGCVALAAFVADWAWGLAVFSAVPGAQFYSALESLSPAVFLLLLTLSMMTQNPWLPLCNLLVLPFAAGRFSAYFALLGFGVQPDMLLVQLGFALLLVFYAVDAVLALRRVLRSRRA